MTINFQTGVLGQLLQDICCPRAGLHTPALGRHTKCGVLGVFHNQSSRNTVLIVNWNHAIEDAIPGKSIFLLDQFYSQCASSAPLHTYSCFYISKLRKQGGSHVWLWAIWTLNSLSTIVLHRFVFVYGVYLCSGSPPVGISSRITGEFPQGGGASCHSWCISDHKIWDDPWIAFEIESGQMPCTK